MPRAGNLTGLEISTEWERRSVNPIVYIMSQSHSVINSTTVVGPNNLLHIGASEYQVVIYCRYSVDKSVMPSRHGVFGISVVTTENHTVLVYRRISNDERRKLT